MSPWGSQEISSEEFIQGRWLVGEWIVGKGSLGRVHSLWSGVPKASSLSRQDFVVYVMTREQHVFGRGGNSSARSGSPAPYVDTFLNAPDILPPAAGDTRCA